MEARIAPKPGDDDFANFFIDVIDCGHTLFDAAYQSVFGSIFLSSSAIRKLPRSIPACLAGKYWPEQLEETYEQKRREYLVDYYKKVRDEKIATKEARDMEDWEEGSVFLKKNAPATYNVTEYYRNQVEEELRRDLIHFRNTDIVSEMSKDLESPVIPGKEYYSIIIKKMYVCLL